MKSRVLTGLNLIINIMCLCVRKYFKAFNNLKRMSTVILFEDRGPFDKNSNRERDKE
jgi:hypothetical protein